MIGLLINILVLCLVISLVLWILTQIPLAEPFGRIARVIIIVVGCLMLLTLLLDIGGMGGSFRLLR